eukprot:TRINITY_DN2022_c5_g1_i2.p1 TRINITY_DN2022_c5_g1~~TRINITY_DN2022_c5_g1_i2.p1  ORF type:complete len:1171 (+),score=241.26 TRINITY_DN2022_c5_g1_i2:141-3653(+)
MAESGPRRGSHVTWFDERLDNSLDWSQYTKNTFIDFDFDETEDDELAASRRERSAPACVVAARAVASASSSSGSRGTAKHATVSQADCAAAIVSFELRAAARRALDRGRGRSLGRTRGPRRFCRSRGGRSSGRSSRRSSARSSARSSRQSSCRSSGRSCCRARPRSGRERRPRERRPSGNSVVLRAWARSTVARGSRSRQSSSSGAQTGKRRSVTIMLSADPDDQAEPEQECSPANSSNNSGEVLASAEAAPAIVAPGAEREASCEPSAAARSGSCRGSPRPGRGADGSGKGAAKAAAAASADAVSSTWAQAASEVGAPEATTALRGRGFKPPRPGFRVRVSNRFAALSAEPRGDPSPVAGSCGTASPGGSVGERTNCSGDGGRATGNAVGAREGGCGEGREDFDVSGCTEVFRIGRRLGSKLSCRAPSGSGGRGADSCRSNAGSSASGARVVRKTSLSNARSSRGATGHGRGSGRGKQLRSTSAAGSLVSKRSTSTTSTKSAKGSKASRNFAASDIYATMHRTSACAGTSTRTARRGRGGHRGRYASRSAAPAPANAAPASQAAARSSRRGAASGREAHEQQLPSRAVTSGTHAVSASQALATAKPEPELKAEQAHFLALLAARGCERAVAGRLRTASSGAGGSCSLVVAVPVVPAPAAPGVDMLSLDLGHILVCEGFDGPQGASTCEGCWAFGTVLAPVRLEGQRGSFRCADVRLLTAELRHGRDGEAVAFTSTSWQEVAQMQSSMHRAKQRGIQNRLRLSRSAWEEMFAASLASRGAAASSSSSSACAPAPDAPLPTHLETPSETSSTAGVPGEVGGTAHGAGDVSSNAACGEEARSADVAASPREPPARVQEEEEEEREAEETGLALAAASEAEEAETPSSPSLAAAQPERPEPAPAPPAAAAPPSPPEEEPAPPAASAEAEPSATEGAPAPTTARSSKAARARAKRAEKSAAASAAAGAVAEKTPDAPGGEEAAAAAARAAQVALVSAKVAQATGSAADIAASAKAAKAAKVEPTKEQKYLLALLAVRLNERLLAGHLRAGASKRIIVATPSCEDEDVAPKDVEDALPLEQGHVVTCEAIDKQRGWAFGTVVSPARLAGKTGCFRCAAVEPLAAELRPARGGAPEAVDLQPATWGEVERAQASLHRLRQKAAQKRLAAIRDACAR